jgi:hypothetical protein
MKAKFVGAVRLVTALAILGSVYWQVSDRIAHRVFHPEEYWVYFTIDTSLLMAALLLAGFAVAWFKNNQSAHWFEVARIALSAAYVVVAVVYNALLRGEPDDARDIAAGYHWPTPPNEVLHVWAPLVLVVELIVVRPSIRVKFVEALWAAAYPLVWLMGSIVRGNVNHWWPYWFINPDRYGVPSMLTYIAGITVILIITAFLLLALRSLVSRLKLKG